MTGSRDPIEGIIRAALTRRECRFIEGDRNPTGLDFYLPDALVYIEVKQFHSDRISGQMARAPNVIAIQGAAAAMWFADQIEWSIPPACRAKPPGPTVKTPDFDSGNGGSSPPEAAT